MVDITALITGMEAKYVVLGVLSIVCAEAFTALYFSLKQNFNKTTLHSNLD